MIRHIRNIGSIFLAFMFVLVIAYNCSFGVKKSFLVTQKTFNEAVTNYIAYYNAAPENEQNNLKANVHPLISEALDLLRNMNEAIRLGIEPSQIDRDKFRDIRYKLYQKLPKIFEKEN